MGVALVTGGGTGIGRATVHQLVGRGWSVVVSGRRVGPLEAVVREVGEPHARAVAGDISDPDAAAMMVHTAVSVFGGLDLLVNNAGLAIPGSLAETSLEALHEMISVNLTGTLLVTRAAIAPLSDGGGSIVNIGSVGGVVASRVSPVYAAAKAGVHHLSTCLARELAPAGIRVNTVVPGPVQTDILEPAAMAVLSKTTLRNRVGTPEEVARWVVFLSDLDSDWITGTMITIDGGFVIGP